jgi:hypothetical protein
VQTATIQREGKAILLIGSIVAAHPAVLEDLKALATELKVSNVAINFDAGELKIAVQLEPCAEIEPVEALVPDDAKELAAISGSGGLAAGLPSAQDLDTVAAEKAIAQTTAPPAPKKTAAKKAAKQK